MTLREIANGYRGQIEPGDVDILAAFALETTKESVMRDPDRILSSEEEASFRYALDRRVAHEPVAYIVSEKEFFGLPFFVTRDTLVPRPETEHLVEEALALLSKHDDKTVIADIGTGSGAIIISLVHSLHNKNPDSTSYTFIGTDISPAALDVAKRNAERNSIHKTVISDKPIPSNFDQISDGSYFTNPSPGIPGTPFPKGRNSGLCMSDIEVLSPLGKGSPESSKGGIFTSTSTVVQSNSSLEKRFDIDFFEGNLLDPIPENTFEKTDRILVLANLPYLSRELYESTDRDVRLYEPESALVAEEAGLALYARLLEDIARRKKSGWKKFRIDGLFEISPEQESSLAKRFVDIFPDSTYSFLPDLSGRTRVFRFRIE